MKDRLSNKFVPYNESYSLSSSELKADFPEMEKSAILALKLCGVKLLEESLDGDDMGNATVQPGNTSEKKLRERMTPEERMRRRIEILRSSPLISEPDFDERMRIIRQDTETRRINYIKSITAANAPYRRIK